MSRRDARLVLATGILFGAVALGHFWTARRGMLAINFEVYYHAGRAVLSADGGTTGQALVSAGDLYAVTPPDHPAYRYLYPPIAVIAFLPFALFKSPWPGFVVLTAVQIGVGLALARLLWRFVAARGVRLDRIDRALIAGFVVGSSFVVPSLFFGNVNLLLAVGVAAAVVWVERDRDAAAGVALALASLPKVFPAAVGAWFLLRRSWRAAAASVATGAGLAVASVVLFGVDLHRTYLQRGLLSRVDPSRYAGGMDPNLPYATIRRPLSILLPDADPTVLAVLAFGLLAPAVVALLWDPDGPVDRLVAVHGLLVGLLLALPSYFVYYVLLYVSLIPLLYLLDGPGRTPFVAGALLATVTLTLDSFVRFVDVVPFPPAVASVA
ncbi:MAG: glycosyltransferase family 87 protein, partial [Halolamina sp.]